MTTAKTSTALSIRSADRKLAVGKLFFGKVRRRLASEVARVGRMPFRILDACVRPFGYEVIRQYFYSPCRCRPTAIRNSCSRLQICRGSKSMFENALIW